MRFILFFSLLALSSLANAECSFKVINHDSQSFIQMGAKASIGNLAIALCSELADQDEKVKANCSSDPDNTLYSHPHQEITCKVTNGWPIYLQLADQEPVCTGPQETQGRHIVVHYPQDFKKCL